MRPFVALFVGIIASAPLAASAAGPTRPLIEVDLNGQRVEGTALSWSRSSVFLLARDGRLWDFAPQTARDFRKLPTGFTSYSPGAVRAQLQAELGNRFEVTGVGHYLVAYPAGQRSQWAQRFEDLYRSFLIYFSVRGFQLQTPEFPLIAIVMPSHAEFLKYSAQEGKPLPAGVLGYYSPTTNRVALYDITDGERSSAAWHTNAETIIHEATHQTAFNTGIHSRFASQPRWAVEGLATVFEAPGVWNSRANPNLPDRINRTQLRGWQQYRSHRRDGALVELISADGRFNSSTLDAYAEAWALSFFLLEKQPRDYAAYLQRLAALPVFEERTSAERLADFTGVFGTNFRLLEARFLRFMDELR
ncbi:MAG: DUF1570 domain-containing protein [Pirellulales bacterium]|nr:DUF1570 domain-containing protein [Pirellulales bacterium]